MTFPTKSNQIGRMIRLELAVRDYVMNCEVVLLIAQRALIAISFANYFANGLPMRPAMIYVSPSPSWTVLAVASSHPVRLFPGLRDFQSNFRSSRRISIALHEFRVIPNVSIMAALVAKLPCMRPSFCDSFSALLAHVGSTVSRILSAAFSRTKCCTIWGFQKSVSWHRKLFVAGFADAVDVLMGGAEMGTPRLTLKLSIAHFAG